MRPFISIKDGPVYELFIDLQWILFLFFFIFLLPSTLPNCKRMGSCMSQDASAATQVSNTTRFQRLPKSSAVRMPYFPRIPQFYLPSPYMLPWSSSSMYPHRAPPMTSAMASSMVSPMASPLPSSMISPLASPMPRSMVNTISSPINSALTYPFANHGYTPFFYVPSYMPFHYDTR
ncbi:hypothetical protein BC940DRAFT_16223 [Gongronella butleri]|nr:hypothetical protein BC940DRAFT_16223 [Gongronella butleri]